MKGWVLTAWSGAADVALTRRVAAASPGGRGVSYPLSLWERLRVRAEQLKIERSHALKAAMERMLK
jgi:hypothetical protein